MKKYPTPTEIVKKILEGKDPFAPYRPVEYAALFRRRKVYRYRRPPQEVKRDATSRPRVGRRAVSKVR